MSSSFCGSDISSWCRSEVLGDPHPPDAAALHFVVMPSDAPGTTLPLDDTDTDALFALLRNLQHSEHSIRVIVAAVSAVIDAVLAADMRPPLQQPQLAKQLRMIWQRHRAAREGRQAFNVEPPFR